MIAISCVVINADVKYNASFTRMNLRTVSNPEDNNYLKSSTEEYVEQPGLFLSDLSTTKSTYAHNCGVKARSASAQRAFVEEGKTWWYCAGLSKEEISDKTGLNKAHAEYGFSIGSKVVIDNVEWNSVYLKMRYINMDPENRNSDPFVPCDLFYTYDEDSQLWGYIREENGRVYTHSVQTQDFGYYEFRFAPAFTGGENVLIYDFSNDVQSYVFGSGASFGSGDANIVLTLKEKKVIENSGSEFKDYYFESDLLKEYLLCPGSHFVESVGALSEENPTYVHLFFMPYATTLSSGGNGAFYLTYVTDAENNVIYEGVGGRKLWEYHNSDGNGGNNNGVNDITVDSDNAADVKWYDLRGIEISEPTERGVYIRRQGNTVRKVML